MGPLRLRQRESPPSSSATSSSATGAAAGGSRLRFRDLLSRRRPRSDARLDEDQSGGAHRLEPGTRWQHGDRLATRLLHAVLVGALVSGPAALCWVAATRSSDQSVSGAAFEESVPPQTRDATVAAAAAQRLVLTWLTASTADKAALQAQLVAAVAGHGGAAGEAPGCARPDVGGRSRRARAWPFPGRCRHHRGSARHGLLRCAGPGGRWRRGRVGPAGSDASAGGCRLRPRSASGADRGLDRRPGLPDGCRLRDRLSHRQRRAGPLDRPERPPDRGPPASLRQRPGRQRPDCLAAEEAPTTRAAVVATATCQASRPSVDDLAVRPGPPGPRRPMGSRRRGPRPPAGPHLSPSTTVPSASAPSAPTSTPR